MAVVYVLKSRTSGRLYIGSTSDLTRRLEEHARGHSPHTRERGPWDLVYQEEYPELVEARRRERQLKSWKSHRSIQELIDAQRVS